MFDSAELSTLAYANGFALWHYRTSDTSAVVQTRGYFNTAKELLRAGDQIMCNLGNGTYNLVIHQEGDDLIVRKPS
jgi:hypothetical protein